RGGNGGAAEGPKPPTVLLPGCRGCGDKGGLKRVLRACILENHEEKKQMASCPSNYSCVGNS
ncbi:hypothetical protein PIB30_075899, partial [Stylosanthes scabra]|nr:hypothetical protein [Stylosanthes scabra]